MTSAVATDPMALLAQIADIGRDGARGGYSRHLFTPPELALRTWFRSTAGALGLEVEADANANLWATWGGREDGKGVGTGSHLDSVPGGGAYDGPLGVVSAFAAVARLQEEGYAPSRPVSVIAFAEEEGGRFGAPCLGSRLLTGSGDRGALLGACDEEGITVADAFRSQGLDPGLAGLDRSRLDALEVFLELHIEQGRQLAPRGAALGVATTILAHGRWRVTVTGRGDHAGATELVSRRDPVLAAAALITAARARASAAHPGQHARATVGRMTILPGGTNAIASRVDLWLDARAEHEDEVRSLVAAILGDARDAALAEGCGLTVVEESFSPRVVFDDGLRRRIDRVLGGVPAIPTGAGHDAGVLSAILPTAMLFVRNPEGVSHSPDETATPEDIRAGVDALTAVLRDLA